MAAGERRLYRAELSVGWFLEIEAVQDGVDFTLTATGPRGLNRVADSPNGRHGGERLLLWAETAGTYQVDLEATNADAGAKANPRFALEVVALRAGNAREKLRAEAFASGLEADRQRRSGDPEEMARAVATYKQEAEVWRALDELRGEIHALDGLVLVARALSDRKEQIEASRTLASLYERAGDAARQAEALVDLGEALSEQDQRPAAQEAFRKALRLLPNAPDAETEARAWNGLASGCQQEGQLGEAQNAFQSSIALWWSLGRKRSEAITRANLAYLFAELGEPERALDELEQARKTLPAEPLAEDEAFLLEREVDTLVRLGRLDGVRRRADRALALRRGLGEPRALANALGVAALFEYRTGAFARAGEKFLEAHRLMHQAGDPAGAAVHLVSAGWCRVLGQDWVAAEKSFADALPLLAGANDPRNLAGVLAGLAWVERTQGDLHRARQHALDALTHVEALRSSTRRLNLRASLLADRQQFFDLAVDVLMQLAEKTGEESFVAEAFAVSERAHGRLLLEALPGEESEARSRPGQRTDVEMGAYRVARIDASYRRDRAEATYEGYLRLTEAALRRALDELRDAEAVTASGSATRPVSLAEAQRELLDDDSQLLLYDLGRQRSYLWVVSRHSVHTFVLAGAADLERRALEVYRALAASDQRSTWFQARRRTEALADELLGPALPVLTGRRLLIVREGALLYVPFGALPLPSDVKGDRRPLVARFEIAYLPSASVAVWMRRRKVTPGTGALDVVALAQPLPITAGFGPLPFTADEAQAVVSAAPPQRGRAFVGGMAHKGLITQDRLGEPRYLHFATHGYADERDPELSALVLAARPDWSGDGLLRACEVARLRLRCELVVLSACDSGLGAKIAGEGLVGLPHAFLRAGAGKVLASLWPVNDPAASVLMKDLYQGMLRSGLSPEAALQRAQLNLAARPKWRQPYYWAGFVLIGAG